MEAGRGGLAALRRELEGLAPGPLGGSLPALQEPLFSQNGNSS